MGVDLGDVTQRIRVSVQRCDPHTKTIGRKRISVLHAVGGADHDNDDQQSISSRKQHKIIPTSSNRLELLPQEILVNSSPGSFFNFQIMNPSFRLTLSGNFEQIHLLCKVNRGTLKDLILVSRTVNEAVSFSLLTLFERSNPILFLSPCLNSEPFLFHLFRH